MAQNNRQLLINAASNTAGLLATLAVSFAIAPIVLRAIGDTRYGAWTFAESFVAYLTLFDMGVAAALVRFAPRSLAQNDHAELTRLYSACLVFFSAGTFIALFIGTSFAWFVLDRFLVDSEYQGEFRGLFLILVANFAISLPLSVYPALLDATNRFTYKSLVRTGILLMRVPLTFAVICTEHRLINLGLVIAGCSVIENLLLAAGVFRSLPGLRFQPSSINRRTVKQIATYSRDAVAAMFAGRLAFHTDSFIIAPFLGAAAITPFSFPAKLVEMSKAVLRSATTTLTATFSSLDATNEHDRLRTTFLAGSRAAWYAALPVQVGLLLLGPTFLRLWIGPTYAAAGAPVLYALASVLALTVAQSVASRVLYGTGRLKLFAVATLADGVANLVLSLALVGHYGIAGVALGTAIPHAVFCVGIIAHVCNFVNVSAVDYLKQMVRPLLAVIIPASVWGLSLWHGIDGWQIFFVYGLVGVACHALVVLAFEGQLHWLNRRRDTRPADPLPLRRAG